MSSRQFKKGDAVSFRCEHLIGHISGFEILPPLSGDPEKCRCFVSDEIPEGALPVGKARGDQTAYRIIVSVEAFKLHMPEGRLTPLSCNQNLIFSPT